MMYHYFHSSTTFIVDFKSLQHVFPKFIANLPITFPNSEIGCEISFQCLNFVCKQMFIYSIIIMNSMKYKPYFESPANSLYFLTLLVFLLTTKLLAALPAFNVSKASSTASLNCSASSLLWKFRPYTCLWSRHWWNVGVAALYFILRIIEQFITTYNDNY